MCNGIKGSSVLLNIDLRLLSGGETSVLYHYPFTKADAPPCRSQKVPVPVAFGQVQAPACPWRGLAGLFIYKQEISYRMEEARSNCIDTMSAE